MRESIRHLCMPDSEAKAVAAVPQMQESSLRIGLQMRVPFATRHMQMLPCHLQQRLVLRLAQPYNQASHFCSLC